MLVVLFAPTYCKCACIMLFQVNTTREDGCTSYTCGVNDKGNLVLQTRVTACPTFNRQACLDQGVKLSAISQHSLTCTFLSATNLC